MIRINVGKRRSLYDIHTPRVWPYAVFGGHWKGYHPKQSSCLQLSNSEQNAFPKVWVPTNVGLQPSDVQHSHLQ
jgi:hypothetical protein